MSSSYDLKPSIFGKFLPLISNSSEYSSSMSYFVTKTIRWGKNYLLSILDGHLIHYPSPLNLTYAWSFGSSAELNPIFEFPDQDSASYPVRLKVITDKECSDDTIRPVIIGQEYVMYVPSAFTPNGDNVNDVFLPASTGVDAEDFTFMIFDRWGKKIFESKEKTLGWDGTNIDSGEPAPAGIYVWKLVVGDYSLEKERHEYMGNLMLMR